MLIFKNQLRAMGPMVFGAPICTYYRNNKKIGLPQVLRLPTLTSLSVPVAELFPSRRQAVNYKKMHISFGF